MRLLFWSLATLFVLIPGCTTVQKSQSLTIYPTDAPVTVTSNADARCWDVFAVVWCRLNVEMASTGGRKVSDAADHGTVADHNVAPGGQSTGKTQQLTERLTTLRDLYNRKLISTEVYDQETRKAIKELGQ
jgi:hypothetical protein